MKSIDINSDSVDGIYYNKTPYKIKASVKPYMKDPTISEAGQVTRGAEPHVAVRATRCVLWRGRGGAGSDLAGGCATILPI